MLVEVLVLRRQERVGDQFWDRLDRQIQSAFPRILAEQRAVRRVDARHDRRFIRLKLRIVRQVLGEIQDQGCNAGHASQKHHGSGGEQEAREPYQQAHCRISVLALAVQRPGAFPRTATGARRLSPLRIVSYSMIRKSGHRFFLATNAERVCAEIMLKQ